MERDYRDHDRRGYASERNNPNIERRFRERSPPRQQAWHSGSPRDQDRGTRLLKENDTGPSRDYDRNTRQGSSREYDVGHSRDHDRGSRPGPSRAYDSSTLRDHDRNSSHGPLRENESGPPRDHDRNIRASRDLVRSADPKVQSWDGHSRDVERSSGVSRERDVGRHEGLRRDGGRAAEPRDAGRVSSPGARGGSREMTRNTEYAQEDSRWRRKSRSRSRSRSRDRERDRDKRRSRRSRSKSRSRSRSRSRHSSEDEWVKLKAKRKANQSQNKKNKWDKPPEGLEGPLPTPGILTITPQLLQATMVAANPQQTRQARRLYVGNIPAGISEMAIAEFFNQVLKETGKCSHIPPVGNVQIHAEKAFAFLEFVRVEDATLCMLLDGIVFENQKVKVRRPKDYMPIPGISSNPEELAKDLVLPGVVSTNVKDTPFKVYLGNLPTHLTDAQVQTLVSAFGTLRSFHLVTEAASSTSKGYCFFEYADTATTAFAVQGLNGMQMGDKTLTCSFANADKAATALSLSAAGVDTSLLDLKGSSLSVANTVLPVPTNILRLGNMVTEMELRNNEEYEDILTDVQQEMCEHGKVVDIKIPRPDDVNGGSSGVGFIFVNFAAPEDALAAYKAMSGRQFAGKLVHASFYDEMRYSLNDLE